MSVADNAPSTLANLTLATLLMATFVLLANGRHLFRRARRWWNDLACPHVWRCQHCGKRIARHNPDDLEDAAGWHQVGHYAEQRAQRNGDGPGRAA